MMKEGSTVAASMLVNSTRDGFAFQSPLGAAIKLNQSLATTDSLQFASVSVTGPTIAGSYLSSPGSNFHIDSLTGKVIVGYFTNKTGTGGDSLQVYNNTTDKTLLFNVTSSGTSSGSNSVNVNTNLNVSGVTTSTGQIKNNSAVSSTPGIQSTGMIQSPYIVASLNNAVYPKMLALYDGTSSGVQSDHRFNGFGVQTGQLRYQLNGTGDAHVFYAATGAGASNTLATIAGNGTMTVPGTISTGNLTSITTRGTGTPTYNVNSNGNGTGIGPAVSFPTSNSAMGGFISITIGASPVANGGIIQVIFPTANPFTNFFGPSVIICPANQLTAGTYGVNNPYVVSTNTSFTIMSGSVALTQGNTYQWYYQVVG
jgi:hypothetical protein